MNIDKDIEILEEKKKALDLHIDNYYKNDCETAICRELVKERDAIENVLKELKDYKTEHKIMKKILVEHNLWETLINDDEFIEYLIESVRKELEKDE